VCVCVCVCVCVFQVFREFYNSVPFPQGALPGGQHVDR